MCKKITAAILILTVCFCQVALAKKASNFKIELTGIEGPVKENVLKRLDAFKAAFKPPFSRHHIRLIFDQGPDHIREAMKPYGYFKPHVESELVRDGSTWLAKYTVNPGPELPIATLNITLDGPGKDNPALQQILKNTHLKVGETFTSKAFKETKKSLLKTAEREGFINAKLTESKLIINLNTYSASITLTLETGDEFYFGPITFNKTFYSEEFLRRFLDIKENEPYSADKLLDLQEDLSQSPFFSHVSITPHIQKAVDHHVPIDIIVTPSKSKRYRVGLGYGTYTEFRGTLGMDFLHLTPTGHHASIFVTQSAVQSSATAQYVIPAKHPLTDQYRFRVQKQREDFNDSLINYQNIAAALIKTHKSFQQKWELTYQEEKYSINENDPSTRSNVLMPSVFLSHNTADDLVNPTQGHKLTFQLRGASEQALSDTNFAQSLVEYKHLYPLNKNNRFIFRGSFGYTEVTDLEKLPLSLRFYAGGINSIRAFRYKNIGPGRYLKLASAEYQRRITGNFYIPFFFDTGTASDQLNHSLEKGAGSGLVYRSVVGSIELYYGRALTKPGQPWRFEFNIGTVL